ncbi:hypothetical protein AAVH_11090 [Aphelenchoides avenae]|nr:hypothetical protein AAVH_11090 [Aphelenchus avenae]
MQLPMRTASANGRSVQTLGCQAAVQCQSTAQVRPLRSRQVALAAFELIEATTIKVPKKTTTLSLLKKKPVMLPNGRKRRNKSARSANAIEEPEKKFYRFLKAYGRVAKYAEFSMNESCDPKKFVAKRGVTKQWIEFNTQQN